jgi:DNA-binding NarL/FixJ family response regulator
VPISVLIVDDDPSFRDLAARLLAACDLDVAGQAGSVAEALDAAKATKPDAALVDVDLPDGNGIALAEQLTTLPWSPRVVLTSVDGDAARSDDVSRSGAVTFVHKADLPNRPLDRLLGPE